MGILAGKSFEDSLKITHLILPQQTGNGYKCEMVDSPSQIQRLNQYLSDESILQLGWIHTHPQVLNSNHYKQKPQCISFQFDAYFSSTDCHTQFFGQKDMKNYIGIGKILQFVMCSSD